MQDNAGPSSRGHVVEAASFEDAALGYLEIHHPPISEDDGVCLQVEDMDTGERQCLRIDLASGAAEPCD